MLVFITILSDHQNIIIQNGASKLFIKEFSFESSLVKELAGYEIVSKYYPVARLLNRDTCQKENRLVFEFEKSIGSNRGLLLDIFNKTESISSFDAIFQMYKTVFDKTIEKTPASAADIFFKDRAMKLKEKYLNLCKTTEPVELNFKESHISINFSEIVDRVMSHFEEEGQRESWSIISQGDPSDVNVGIKPVLLDYLCGGKVPMMAEFASLVWEQVAQSAILAPTYNPKAYTDHDLVYKNPPAVSMQNGHLEFVIPKERLLFLTEYTTRVITPIIERIEYPDWFYDFKNYIAMRILGVFDINNFSLEHKLLALVYLELFYNVWTPQTPLELIELITK
jgi:hypothetical protein